MQYESVASGRSVYFIFAYREKLREGIRMKIHRLNLNDALANFARSLARDRRGTDIRCISFASLLVLTPSASAQKTSGTITGTVAIRAAPLFRARQSVWSTSAPGLLASNDQ